VVAVVVSSRGRDGEGVYSALLRTSERNARATTTTTAAVVVAAAASTVDTGAAARFACPERRAPHTDTQSVAPLARILYVHTRVPVTGVQRATLRTHPPTHAHTAALAHIA